jgi:hypothetical protein
VKIDDLIGGIDFGLWLSRIGRSRSTGLRWRDRGWVAPVNIDGHLFVAQEEIDRFWARAKAGEFAKEAGGIICIQREGAKKPTSKTSHPASSPSSKDACDPGGHTKRFRDGKPTARLYPISPSSG